MARWRPPAARATPLSAGSRRLRGGTEVTVHHRCEQRLQPHPVCPVDDPANAHGDLQQQRRIGHDGSADRQRPDRTDGTTPSHGRATPLLAGTRNAGGTGTAYANDAIYSFAADITLYAQWTANTYTVTFDANGGSAPDPGEQGGDLWLNLWRAGDHQPHGLHLCRLVHGGFRWNPGHMRPPS